MAYKLKDRKEKMLYKGSVYELTLQWDRESLRKCFCGMPPFYAHIRKDGANFAQIDCYSNGDDFSVVPMHPLFILKSKDLHAVSYFVNRPLELDRCWQSYKVATRHHYRPSDMGLWADTIRLLEQCGKDICNPKFICPQNLRAEHDYWMNRHNQKGAETQKPGADAASQTEGSRVLQGEVTLLRHYHHRQKPGDFGT